MWPVFAFQVLDTNIPGYISIQIFCRCEYHCVIFFTFTVWEYSWLYFTSSIVSNFTYCVGYQIGTNITNITNIMVPMLPILQILPILEKWLWRRWWWWVIILWLLILTICEVIVVVVVVVTVIPWYYFSMMAIMMMMMIVRYLPLTVNVGGLCCGE